MESLSIRYFIEAAKDLNFTKTAARLYISQQNLSNHIARLEAFYDVKLFERKPRLALTYAGEAFLAYANKHRMEEDNIKNILTDIKRKEKGILHIGASSSRSSIAIPALTELFMEKYPHVELHFHHHHSNTLAHMLLQGELDFSIGIDLTRHPNLVSTPLFTDSLYIMVADSLLRKQFGKKTDALIARSRSGADLREFSVLPFINIESTNITTDCFSSIGVTPNFIVTSNYPMFFLPHYFEKVAASIITKTVFLHVRNDIPDSVHVFPIQDSGMIPLNSISFTRHKHKYLSQYGQDFMKITEEYFNSLNK